MGRRSSKKRWSIARLRGDRQTRRAIVLKIYTDRFPEDRVAWFGRTLCRLPGGRNLLTLKGARGWVPIKGAPSIPKYRGQEAIGLAAIGLQ